MFQILKNRTFLIVAIIDALLVAAYYYYQPYCEPCLINDNCPPCISNEQITIIYVIIIFSSVYIVSLIWKRIKYSNKKI